jgi:hypothetical protein
MRQAAIEAAGYRCQLCGIRQWAIREGREGKPCVVYLQLCHKNQYETWKDDAETMVCCQWCHRRYDRKFRRKAGTRHRTPVGYASVYLEDRGRKVLVEMVTTLDELRDVVAALPSSALVEIQLVMILAVVGNGYYHKQGDELVATAEYGACMGLGAQLGPVVKGHEQWH